MKQLTSLVWKEWREVRVYLWIAIGVFIGLPVVGGMEDVFQHTAQRFEISASPWVVTFGGVLAIFVAVGATCRDFSGHLEDFWRSRPVGVVRWLVVKYLVGLAIVLVGCALPLAVELRFNREKHALVLIIWLPFLWMALYSIGFLSGCLLRRTAHAAMFALAAMLLVYFLPMILPPLEWMNVNKLTEFDYMKWSSWPNVWLPWQWDFGAGMLVLAIVVVALAFVAAKRDWRIESGRAMMYGSVSSALLILFASAAFRMGTNLPILQQADLPKDEFAELMRQDGNDGFIVTQRQTQSNLVRFDPSTVEHFSRQFQVNDSGFELGSPVRAIADFYAGYTGFPTPPGHPEIQYRIQGYELPTNGNESWSLEVASIDKGVVEGGQRLWDEENDAKSWAPLPTTYVWQGRLYVIGSRLAMFDISEPLKPRLISEVPFGYSDHYLDLAGVDEFPLNLPPVVDLPPQQRAEVAVKRHWGWESSGLEGDIFCAWSLNINTLCEYRLTKLSDSVAVFKKVGQYQTTMLDRVFGFYGYYDMKMLNGLLYMSQGGNGGPFNPAITVFETRGEPPLRIVGHFAAPGIQTVCPLPDGRALVGGSKLWLVGPPQRHGSD